MNELLSQCDLVLDQHQLMFILGDYYFQRIEPVSVPFPNFKESTELSFANNVTKIVFLGKLTFTFKSKDMLGLIMMILHLNTWIVNLRYFITKITLFIIKLLFVVLILTMILIVTTLIYF